MPVSPPVLTRLKAVVAPGAALESDADTDPFVRDWRGRYRGVTPLVLRPGSTAEVAAIVAICAETGTAVVPQGGNTGMVAGGIPRTGGEDVVLSLSRMKRIRNLDPVNHTMTVEAGCVLADVQAAAREAGRLFPLSLAAEGSCQIGGNLSTNAGGTAVLRYGNARDLVLGLEVVLPDGTVWDGLRALRKDNSGFDLKQVFLGAEGSLGIITAAVIKLFPLPAEVVTAMVTLPAPGRRHPPPVAPARSERRCGGDLRVHRPQVPGPGARAHTGDRGSPGFALCALRTGRARGGERWRAPRSGARGCALGGTGGGMGPGRGARCERSAGREAVEAAREHPGGGAGRRRLHRARCIGAGVAGRGSCWNAAPRCASAPSRARG